MWWLTGRKDVDAGRQTVDVGVYRASFTGGVDGIRALGESLESIIS